MIQNRLNYNYILQTIFCVFQTLQQNHIFAVHRLNLYNGEQIKSTHRRVLSHFAQTIFGEQLMNEHEKIEQPFSNLKDKGLEQPRGYR